MDRIHCPVPRDHCQLNGILESVTSRRRASRHRERRAEGTLPLGGGLLACRRSARLLAAGAAAKPSKRTRWNSTDGTRGPRGPLGARSVLISDQGTLVRLCRSSSGIGRRVQIQKTA
ncbi:hypothetical protein SKAU_G00103480 [Synaphobranchus kaupii]|uniref:Uncharacterized protein n=1 Tax=Synaphobranchus kaupii TaxID=118154 RepID=A0A9Q1J5H4_SYNKA|nr:hypothetical protein SKAU_G00103480 [Synaphobranchus kaupii]